jgi:SAM-dependent methyltransferase
MNDHDDAAWPLGCGSPIAFSALAVGDVVLDLGGAGIDLLSAAATVGPSGRVIGVDTLKERARVNASEARLDSVEVRRGTIESLPVEDGVVDWVISSCAISRASDKARVFAEIARVLKIGGRMWAADIVAEGLPEWLRRVSGLRDSPLSGAISEAEYVAGLRTAGLAELSLGGRYVYDCDQLAQIAPWTETSSGHPNRVTEALIGHVWSVYISATKPPVNAKETEVNDETDTATTTEQGDRSGPFGPVDRSWMEQGCGQTTESTSRPDTRRSQDDGEGTGATTDVGCCPRTWRPHQTENAQN